MGGPKLVGGTWVERGNKAFENAPDKATLFAENFSKNSNIDDSGISLPVFLSNANLKLHNICVTPKMVKKGHNEPWFIKGIWSWLYSSGGSKELWAWIFINTSWTLQYVSEGVFFSRMSECLIGGTYI